VRPGPGAWRLADPQQPPAGARLCPLQRGAWARMVVYVRPTCASASLLRLRGCVGVYYPLSATPAIRSNAPQAHPLPTVLCCCCECECCQAPYPHTYGRHVNPTHASELRMCASRHPPPPSHHFQSSCSTSCCGPQCLASPCPSVRPEGCHIRCATWSRCSTTRHYIKDEERKRKRKRKIKRKSMMAQDKVI
jgi:hypothetical protein